jgi:hypothetical protein
VQVVEGRKRLGQAVGPDGVGVDGQALVVGVGGEGGGFPGGGEDSIERGADALGDCGDLLEAGGDGESVEVADGIAGFVVTEELNQLEVATQVIADAFEFLEIEALEEDAVGAGAVAGGREDFEDGFREVAALLAVPRGKLELGIDSRRVVGTCGLVEAVDKSELIGERGDAEGAGPGGEAVWKDGPAGFDVDAFGDAQSADFFEGEIEDVVAAVRAVAVGEDAGDIGDCVEVDVVEDDGDVVFRKDDVLLEIVGPHRVSEDLGLGGVLWEVGGSAAVGDDEGHGGAGVGSGWLVVVAKDVRGQTSGVGRETKTPGSPGSESRARTWLVKI